MKRSIRQSVISGVTTMRGYLVRTNCASSCQLLNFFGYVSYCCYLTVGGPTTSVNKNNVYRGGQMLNQSHTAQQPNLVSYSCCLLHAPARIEARLTVTHFSLDLPTSCSISCPVIQRFRFEKCHQSVFRPEHVFEPAARERDKISRG